MNITQTFYNNLVSQYDKLFLDWQASTKEQAIMKLCEICEISIEDIVAFGDDLVDIGMLQLCGKGIAMGNALQEVKNIADIVIGTNDEDGIAQWLEENYGL